MYLCGWLTLLCLCASQEYSFLEKLLPLELDPRMKTHGADLSSSLIQESNSALHIKESAGRARRENQGSYERFWKGRVLATLLTAPSLYNHTR